jgi:hypothetical protein
VRDVCAIPFTLAGVLFSYDSRMFGRHPESRDFMIAFMATCLVAGGFVAYAYWIAPDRAKPGAQGTQVDVRENHEDSTNSHANPPQVIATFYECNDDNGRVLSDQPCGDDAQVRHIEMPNLMRTQPNSNSARPATPSGSTRTRAARAPIEQDMSRYEARCESIDARINDINARMHQGYTSLEGEYFRQRLRELSEQRWVANCHR